MRYSKISKTFHGTSLIELIVASFISGLILLEIYWLAHAGSQFYRRTRGQSEIQRESLLALRWMSKDLAEGSALSFRYYKKFPTPGGAPERWHGISFGSFLAADGSGVARQNGTGRMLWASVICYYIDNDDHGLYRQVRGLADPTQTIPPIIDDSLDAPKVMAALPKGGTTYRPIARGVQEISVVQGPKDVQLKLDVRDVDLGFGIEVQTRLEMKN